ncbi:endo-1,3-beta-glucanase Engl1 [Pochonia chlamydosporia 170]|uniref:glucan endo-1,3-beta-D-glucosidase n=1 Tax=Pochonia chlamydosporia 170 TaxID=1380566 RepID=A0A179G948_METCM|nr:endo-1,3-beta-glucanase Engl1 [Pochonia chlamydosporia 170]OAQ73903.1 endo-1,3-beta-glucanase Engl1 [Pochonia chlamydosporia 170]
MTEAAQAVIYPRYCFHLSPTANSWCLVTASDIHGLRQHPGFEGENFFFYKNLPIKWARVVGPVVAIDEAAGRRRIYTIDDSSGKCIEALVKMPPPTTLNDAPRRMQARAGAAAGGAAEPSAPDSDSLGPYGHIDVGDVVDVKGALSTFREKAQINVEKMVIVKGTAQEVKLWEKRTKFRQEVLDRTWILSEKEIRRCRKEAEASDARLGKKKKHLKAVSEGGTGYPNDLCTSDGEIVHYNLERGNRSTERWWKKNYTCKKSAPQQRLASADIVETSSNISRETPQELRFNSTDPALTSGLGPKETEKAASLFQSLFTTMAPQDIFDRPVDTKAPPSTISVRKDHPEPRKGIRSQAPLQTNKFYSNFFLGDQTGPSFTFPYSVAWARGKGASGSWGLSCSHIDEQQRVFGNEKFNGASSYYLNPIGIQSMVISAKELGKETALSTDSITAFSARVHLSKNESSEPAVSYPLVQGMAYITAQFDGSVPLIQSGVFFKAVSRVTNNPKDHVTKYNFHLEDGTTWRVYGWRTKGDELDLKVVNNGLAESKNPFYGIIQVCKDPVTKGSEELFDDGAGVYPVTVTLSGSAVGKEGSYCFKFQKDGHQLGHLYMFALPHHVSSFNGDTKERVQDVRLQSPTKGVASLVKGSEWTMVERNMPIDMQFAPWHPEKGSMAELSDKAKGIIRAAAAKELSQNIPAQTNLDSMYFSGKALAKFATILYVVQELLRDKTLAKKGLGPLKAAFGTFAANKQKFPLVYESKFVAAWGGIVSSASYETGDAGIDFGNTYYNDHHFHYGYHILAAATIGQLDSEWAKANKDYVNLLVRDVANPSAEDKHFPLWRSFDWYHGHSWAHGLYAAMDGKNQESSSEDMMCAYALKMWGKVIKNSDLEMRGNLQLSIISRSLQSYYLYKKDNTVQPKQFIGNKVAGILFENKIDHTTFFDPNIEAIQGIHMIPILPPTPFVRDDKFVKEEWEAYFSKGRVDDIRNAWKGIIYANYATVDPKKAWDFFTSRDFDPQWLDGGASMTWFMAYAAALGRL